MATSAGVKPGVRQPVAFWTNAPGAECSFVSAGWYDLTGQRKGRALGPGWLEAVHPDDRARVERGFARAYEKRMAVSIDYRLRCANGGFRRVLDAGTPRLDRRGRFLGIVGSVVESPAAPDLAESIIASDPVARALFQHITAGVAIVREGGHFVRVNDRFCGIAGRGRAELAAMSLLEVVHPGDRPRNAESFQRMMSGGPGAEFDERYVRPDGSIIWVRNLVFAIASSDGRARLGVVIVSDISDRQRMEFERHMRRRPDGRPVLAEFDGPDSLLNVWLRNRKRDVG